MIKSTKKYPKTCAMNAANLVYKSYEFASPNNQFMFLVTNQLFLVTSLMGYLQFAPQIMKMLNHHPNCNKPCKLHPIVLKLTVHASHVTTKNLVYSPPPPPQKKIPS